MSELPPSEPKEPPESLEKAVERRFAAVVYIMRGRRSILSHLGILERDEGSLSLRDRKDALLFAVPAASVEARPRQRFFGKNQTSFAIHAADRWWDLVAWVPTPYQRRSTRDLVERYRARDRVPRPASMSEETYLRLTSSPVQHQQLWKACWLAVLS